MQRFSEDRFRRQVDQALTKIQTVLDTNRHPAYPDDVGHQYEDKFGLAEFLTSTALAAQLNVLELLGLNEKGLKQLRSWAASRSVTLRLMSEETCEFEKEVTRKVESNTERVSTYQSSSGYSSSFTDKVITTITEYLWKFRVKYKIVAFQGNNTDEKLVILEHKGSTDLKTSTKVTPHPTTAVVPHKDVNITWLLQQINDAGQFTFAIDRIHKLCRTPRRNPNIDGAISHFLAFSTWAQDCSNYFQSLFAKQTTNDANMSMVNDDSLFVPVVPLFEEPAVASARKVDTAVKASSSPSLASVRHPGAAADKSGSVLLSVADVNSFLIEQKRSWKEKAANIAKAFPDDSKLVSTTAVQTTILARHAVKICQFFTDGVNYVELMLRKQVIAAIGKEVGPVEFTNYMRFHNRKLFRHEFEQRPFCHAIRRPDHYPEGVVSIEQTLADGSAPEPVYTTARVSHNAVPMSFALDAATKVTFGGTRYIHAYVAHKFSTDTGSTLNLVARARQFSSFVLLVGRIASATLFEPKGAIVIQNKDDLKIPLLLEALPTPKEFKDAIVSMSPEQQAFCKAYRSMQLESSLFGIVVLQIKPQLEKLLKLPDDSLTKEIRLTQDLCELFQKYQIPSDLLSYDGPKEASPAAKVGTVKAYVQTMRGVVGAKAESELVNRIEEHLYSYSESDSEIESDCDDECEEEADYFSAPVKRKSVFKEKEQKEISVRSPVKRKAAPSKPASRIGSSIPTSRKQSAPSSAPATTSGAVKQGSASDAAQDEESVEQQELEVIDFTKIPVELDQKFDKLDVDSALRPTTINIGLTWTKTSQAALLASPTTITLNTEEQKTEMNRAFDLLDALSRSGSLSFDHAELHVVVASTHCFDKTLMDTIVVDNVNPIEKVERSSLIIASTIHGLDAGELIKAEHLERVQAASPMLFIGNADDN